MKKLLIILLSIITLLLTVSCSDNNTETEQTTAIKTTTTYSTTVATSTTSVTSASETTFCDEAVYITAKGKKYHKKGCSYLRITCIEVNKTEAIDDGYTPCSRCFP